MSKANHSKHHSTRDDNAHYKKPALPSPAIAENPTYPSFLTSTVVDSESAAVCVPPKPTTQKFGGMFGAPTHLAMTPGTLLATLLNDSLDLSATADPSSDEVPTVANLAAASE